MSTTSRQRHTSAQQYLRYSVFLHCILACLTCIGLILPTQTALAAPPLQITAGCVVYVNGSMAGDNGNGDSWANAYRTLQPAMNAAAEKYTSTCPGGAEVWVAAGTYHPGTLRTDSFTLKSGVAVFGGFAGNETERSTRSWTNNPTILSGEIGTAGIADNSYHVVTASGVNKSSILDGFTITGGNADGATPLNAGGGMYNTASSPTLSNLIVTENNAQVSGGGIYNTQSSSPSLQHITFLRNHAKVEGGGGLNNFNSSPILNDVIFDSNTGQGGAGMMDRYYSSPVLINVAFRNNDAAYDGGGIYNYSNSSPTLLNVIFHNNTAFYGGGISNSSNSNPTITNAIFSLNTARSTGGAVNNYQSSPVLSNVTISGNAARDGSAMYTGGSNTNPLVRNSIIWGNPVSSTGYPLVIGQGFLTTNFTLTYTLAQGCGGSTNWHCGTDGGHNLDIDPLLLNIGTGSLVLSSASPAINIGSNAFLPADLYDLDGDGNTSETLPVDLNGNPRSLETAVDLGAYERVYTARPNQTIFYVKAGAASKNDGSSWANAFTNLQSAIEQSQAGDEIRVAEGTYSAGDKRSYFFLLKNGVALYGGFAGDENSPTTRDTAQYPTVLSGEIGAEGIADNSYHVLLATGTGAPARLDGFTITGGSADLTDVHNRGAGLFNTSNPILSNLIFQNNTAVTGGGLYNAGSDNIQISRVIFTANTATQDGGGMACNGTGSVVLVNVSFLGNNAARNGGGMYNNICGISLLVANAIFYGNTAGSQGGGIYIYGGIQTLVNMTVVGNRAGPSAGGIYHQTSGISEWRNLIIWGNTANYSPQIGASGANFRYPRISNSLIMGCGGSGSWDFGCGNDQGGNLDANPQFMGAGAGDLRLRPFSPAINAGSNTLLPSDTTDLDSDGNTTEPLPLDLDGHPRVIGDAVDMGAYEQQAPNHAPVLNSIVSLPNTLEDAAVLPGSRVGSVLADQASDADGDPVGLAVTGAEAISGSWETSPDGVTWAALGPVSETGAALLGPNDWVRFVPHADWNGTARLTVRAWDQADELPTGTTSVDVSLNGKATPYSAETSSLEAAIISVNDAPSFTKGADQTFPEDSGSHTIPGWATAISAGPGDEFQQNLSFLASSDHTSLFTVQPGVNPSGTLTFLPAANANGTAVVTVRVKDDGGTANNGLDISGPQTFTITMTPVDDTIVTLTADPDPVSYGQALTLTARVEGHSPLDTTAPTGQVTFKNGAATLGTGYLSASGETSEASAQAAMTVSNLLAGPHTLTAVYSGDTTYPDAIESPGLAVTITRASASLALSNLNQTYTGTARTVTVNTTPAHIPVRVTYNGSINPPVNAGSYPVQVTIDDPNYTGAASGTLVIAKAPLDVIADSAVRPFGAPDPHIGYHFEGFVNGEGESSISGTPAIGALPGPATSPGHYPIDIQEGSLKAANYEFHRVPGELTIRKAITFVSLTVSPNPSSAGQPVALQAVITSETGALPVGIRFGGNIYFTIAEGSPVAAPPDTNGAAFYQQASLLPGAYDLSARYEGDDNYSESSSLTLQWLIEKSRVFLPLIRK